MKKNKFIVLLVAFLALLPSSRSWGQQQMPQLPMDPAVRYGVLPNGLTYYVRANKLPENRVNFYIAQKVGSVQEEESQRGLAHFLEHMCFNGTQNFPDDNLIRFCERIGVKFGENLNAYTSTDETVYNIDDVPVSPTNIDSCLLILHDWAGNLTLAESEINKERGVIHEEWRMRNNASLRMFERNLPKMYPGSRYGERMPIGLMSVVDNFKPEELCAYYKKWYRPDLQGVIVVGDINVDEIEAKIKKIFTPIVMPANAAKYEHYPVPNNAQPIYIVDKDKEQNQASITILYKHDPMPMEFKNTPAFIAQQMITSLSTQAINARLSELSQKPECPFLGAGLYYSSMLVSKTKDALGVSLVPKPGKSVEAVKAVMEEIERAARFGFNASEILRAREQMLSNFETIYNNRDKQRHNFYTKQYVRHFLEGVPIPDIETEYNIYKAMAPQLPTEAYSETFKQLVASVDTNFICYGFFPDKEGEVIPTVDQLKTAVESSKTAQLTAYVDNVKNEPLVPELPAKGKIVKEAAADFGYTCWTLENGARVFFKTTDFDDSQILFRATSFGGKSKVSDKDLVNLNLHDVVMGSTGLGNFTAIELEKKLTGKQASCAVTLGQVSDNLQGAATPKDLRTLFELIYLRFQKPSNDPESYNSIITALKAQLENVEKLPDAAFDDSVKVTVYGHNPRVARLHLKDLEKADYEGIKRIYSERFDAAGDFDFFFTGAINTDSLRSFVEQYIAPLKGQKQREKYIDLGMEPVKGEVNNHFTRDMETPQGNIIQLWSGDLKYSLKNAEILNALGNILTQRYLKSIREDGGMAYSVGAMGVADYGVKENYMIQIFCPVKPALRDSALLLMEQGIEEIAKSGVTDEELEKVKQFELKDYADSQRKNSYWQSLIFAKTQWNKDLREGKEAVIQKLSSADIQKFVKKVLLKQKNRITVSMLPSDLKE